MGRFGAGKVRQTVGLILLARPFSDSSDVVTFLSDERGVEEAFALGRRSPNSKTRGALETLCLSSLKIIERRQSQLITDAKLVKSWRHLARDPEKFMLVGKILRLVREYGYETQGLLDEVIGFLEKPSKHSALNFVQTFVNKLGFEGLKVNIDLENVEKFFETLF